MDNKDAAGSFRDGHIYRCNNDRHQDQDRDQRVS